jgi:hypothetical protein
MNDADLGLMASLQDILDGKDTGEGVCPEPWESMRRRVLALTVYAGRCAECGCRCADGWALYCVPCARAFALALASEADEQMGPGGEKG